MVRRSSGSTLLICGLISMVGMVVQTSALIRCGQMLAVMIVSGVSGKRVRLLPPFFMLTGVIIANVLVPNGRVLLNFGRFGITLGAIESGLLKGALLVGMIYVSRLSVGRGLRLPGTFGSLLLRAFAYFEALTEQWPATTGPLIARVDDVLVRIHQADSSFERDHSTLTVRPLKNAIIAASLLAIGWVPLLFR